MLDESIASKNRFHTAAKPQSINDLLMMKFSKPKISSNPMDLRAMLLSQDGGLYIAALILSTIQTNNLP